MTDVSKVTTGRLKVGSSVIAAFDAQGNTIVTTVDASPNAPPAGVARAVIEWVRGALHNANEGLRAADLAHALEGDDDHAPRLRRDTLTRELRAVLISGSDGVRGVYGRTFSRGLGLETALPERPDQVLHHAETILQNLATHTAPEPEHEGSSFDLPTLRRTHRRQVCRAQGSARDRLPRGARAADDAEPARPGHLEMAAHLRRCRDDPLRHGDARRPR